VTKSASKRTESDQREYEGIGFIVKWLLAVMGVIVVVFLARMIDYEENPLGFHTQIVALACGISALFCLLGGYFRYNTGRAKGQAVVKRKGVMYVVFGLVILATFFIFHSIMPKIFG